MKHKSSAGIQRRSLMSTCANIPPLNFKPWNSCVYFQSEDVCKSLLRTSDFAPVTGTNTLRNEHRTGIDWLQWLKQKWRSFLRVKNWSTRKNSNLALDINLCWFFQTSFEQIFVFHSVFGCKLCNSFDIVWDSVGSLNIENW